MQNKVPRCSADDPYQPTQLKTTIGDVGLPWVKMIDDHIWMDNKDTIKTFVSQLLYIFIFHTVLYIMILTVLKFFDTSRKHKKVLQVHRCVPFHGLEQPGLWLCGCRRPAYLRGAGVKTGRIASDVRFLMRQKENPSRKKKNGFTMGNSMDILC